MELEDIKRNWKYMKLKYAHLTHSIVGNISHIKSLYL